MINENQPEIDNSKYTHYVGIKFAIKIKGITKNI